MHEPSFGYIFKIILKILGGLFLIGLVGLCFTSIVMLIMLGGSVTALLAWFVGVWNSFSQYNNIYPIPPTPFPSQTAPMLIPTPQTFPTLISTPTSPTVGIIWQTANIDLYGYQVEVPDGWFVEEEKLSIPSSACDLGHDLANYKIFNSNGSEIQIQFLCWARGGEGSVCPGDLTTIDAGRNIARAKMSDIEYKYWGFVKGSDGNLYCDDGWAIASQGNGMTVNEIADYQQTGGAIDLPTVDRIVTSIKPMISIVPTATIILQPPTWTPTPSIQPSPTRTRAPTWTFVAPTPKANVANSPTSAGNSNNPTGATALCKDGTLSYSKTHSGTCSHHGGVSVWYK